MAHPNTQDMADDHRSTLKAFGRALGRESHVLTQQSDLLWQQLYNRLQWEDGSKKDGPITEVITPELRERSKPGARLWLHSLARFRESEALVRTITGHADEVSCVAYSQDGTRIVSGSTDNSLKLWDAATGSELLTFAGHTDWVNAVAYSPDGKYIVSGSTDKTLKVWDAVTGREVLIFTGHRRPVTSCAFSPDGHRIVSASADGVIKIWRIEFWRGKHQCIAWSLGQARCESLPLVVSY